MIRRDPVSLIACAVAPFLALGCATSPDRDPTGGDAAVQPAPGTAVPADLIGEWTLTRLGNTTFRAAAIEGLHGAPSITIQADGSVGGLAGINRWFSSVNVPGLADGQFLLSPAGSTMMAGSDEAMRAETSFLGELGKATTFDRAAVAQGSLVLRDASGAEVLAFRRGN
jgi:heat shock protein HslJ